LASASGTTGSIGSGSIPPRSYTQRYSGGPCTPIVPSIIT
jgi:hypothetical protein